MFQRLQFLAAPVALTALLTISPLKADPKNPDSEVNFSMVVSAGAKVCMAEATANVSIRAAGQVEIMDVTVQNMPPNTEFEFFVIQVPKSPFGVAWYQGAIQTDKHGRGHQQFVGRFSVETFAMALNSAPAPAVFPNDATVNPPFNPVHTYHLGMWFSSPDAATAVGCSGGSTFFSGEHNAGIQAMNTSNFADDHGPLRDVN